MAWLQCSQPQDLNKESERGWPEEENLELEEALSRTLSCIEWYKTSYTIRSLTIYRYFQLLKKLFLHHVFCLPVNCKLLSISESVILNVEYDEPLGSKFFKWKITLHKRRKALLWLHYVYHYEVVWIARDQRNCWWFLHPQLSQLLPG